MSDRSKDELRRRFNKSPDRDDAEEESDSTDESASPDDSETSDVSETDETEQMDETNGTGQMDETGETEQSHRQSSGGGDGLKERKQVAMYLPASQRSELVDFYEELDARSTLAGEGGLEKNREFYEGLVEFVLDRREEFVGTLGIEIDE